MAKLYNPYNADYAEEAGKVIKNWLSLSVGEDGVNLGTIGDTIDLIEAIRGAMVRAYTQGFDEGFDNGWDNCQGEFKKEGMKLPEHEEVVIEESEKGDI